MQLELEDVRRMTPPQMRKAGENSASVLDSFGGLGIPSDAHAAIVNLSYLLHEALLRLENTPKKGGR